MISSGANAKVKQVMLWQTKAKERREAGIFLTEGLKLFQEAPIQTIQEVYVTGSILEAAQRQPALKLKLEKTGWETVTDEVFARMSDTQTPQGILCVLRRPAYEPEQLFDRPSPLLVLLEDIQDPGNLGTIMRTGEGAGVTGVIMTRGTVDLFHPKTVRATMGSIFRVPFLFVEGLGEIIGKLHERGIRTYAAHLDGERYYDSFSFREGTAFLIGNEARGLRRETAELAQHYLKIPMEGKLESLNAGVAASLLMYEAHRQRRVPEAEIS